MNDAVGVGDDPAHHAPVGACVLIESGSSRIDVSFQSDRCSVVQRMCERCVRMYPIDVELDFVEERRYGAERVDRRADVVPEAGKRQFLRSRAAADRVCSLENEHRVPVTRDLERRSQPVRAGTDDYCVVVADFFLLTGLVSE